jgi:adenylate cyclase class IV
MNTESEISLIICSDNIQTVLDKVKEIHNINDFKIDYNSDEKIIDTYFDDNSDSLYKKKFTLRIRDKNDTNIITLKGPPKYEFHSISRSENEYKWSEEAFGIITKQLKEIIEIDGKEIGKCFDKNPIKTLHQLGFREIHTHINNRKIFDVIKTNDLKNDVISEMDIDDVTFSLNSNLKLFNVSVINIEIEKKGKTNQDGNSAIKIITNYLKQEFGIDTVREWKYGKLALGKGIRRLDKENKLKEFIGSNNYLKCNALDKVKEFVDNKLI